MENGRITLRSGLLSELDVLTPADRAAVDAKVAELGSLPPEQWQQRGVIRISPDEPLYMAPVDESMRLILRADEGKPPEVLYMVQHELLKLFRKAKSRRKHERVPKTRLRPPPVQQGDP